MPKVVTQRCLEQDLNPRPTDRKPKCLTRCTTAPSCGHYSVLNVIAIVRETSLLVLFGCGLGWVVGTNFSFVMVGLRPLDWAGSKKMDPRSIL